MVRREIDVDKDRDDLRALRDAPLNENSDFMLSLQIFRFSAI